MKPTGDEAKNILEEATERFELIQIGGGDGANDPGT